MNSTFKRFLADYREHFSLDSSGTLHQFAPLRGTVATDRIIETLPEEVRRTLPALGEHRQKQQAFAQWLGGQGKSVRVACQLDIPLPGPGIHFVQNADKIFYDFRNTDIVLEDFAKAGVAAEGRMLDFGCSSGRNIATLHRALGEKLALFGVDPAASSIDWARERMPYAQFKVNGQNPPLDFADASFDLIIAKSIWTHFSSRAAEAWFAEMARVLKPGGHFMFSAHGPHDVAYRLTYNQPKPHYERFDGNPAWTRDTFLADLIRGLDEAGFYFRPYKEVGHQGDLRNVENADTRDWGLMFMLPEYLEKELLPPELKIVSRGIGRTGNRHDLYIVRRV